MVRMKRIFGNCPDPVFPGRRPVVSIGMYDGVHLGHRAVIQTLVNRSRERNAPAIAITFDIHPRALHGTGPELICSLEHRLQLIETCCGGGTAPDAIWVLSFTPELAAVSAADFCREYLLGMLNACGVVLGDSGRFGHRGEGSAEFIARAGLDLWSHRVSPVYHNGAVISSSAIRRLVAAGDLDNAAAMLGRRVSVLGTVMPGKQIGRTIGFPTLNIDLHHELHPPRGVYATLARCGDTVWKSVTNIGHRPTVDHKAPGDILIETHLFDFSGNLYNQNVEVQFLQKIRDEKAFPSLEHLKEQIAQDCQSARNLFALTGTDS